MKKLLRACALLALAACLTACGTNDAASFNGSRVINENEINLEYTILNLTDTFTMPLSSGDTVAVDVVSEAGNLALTIAKDGSDPVYEGNGIPTGSFTVTVHESGDYTVTVTGKSAKGSIRLVRQQAE